MSAVNVPNPEGENGQPTRVPTGLPFGERQQLAQQQQAAPTQRAQEPTQAGRAPRGMVQGAFRPSDRPTEPQTVQSQRQAGRAGEPQRQRDPDLLLRALFRRFPHPDIERLLTKRPI